jgi:hypothetical protein
MRKETIEQLKSYTAEIGKSIALKIDITNGDEIKGKADELQRSLALSCHCVALSEMLYNEKLAALIEQEKYSGLSATDKKIVFAGQAKEEIYYLTLCERQNKAIEHSIKELITQLSYLKTEMQNINQ